MSLAIMECGDFGEFQEALKSMRRLDDIIINTVNAAIPTDSFHPDGANACKDLHNQIEASNKKRSETIKKCITLSTASVKKLKEIREQNADDRELSKTLRAEQTKLRMLQVELTVEDLVHQRSVKVFSEKCRKYFKPQ